MSQLNEDQIEALLKKLVQKLIDNGNLKVSETNVKKLVDTIVESMKKGQGLKKGERLTMDSETFRDPNFIKTLMSVLVTTNHEMKKDPNAKPDLSVLFDKDIEKKEFKTELQKFFMRLLKLKPKEKKKDEEKEEDPLEKKLDKVKKEKESKPEDHMVAQLEATATILLPLAEAPTPEPDKAQETTIVAQISTPSAGAKASKNAPSAGAKATTSQQSHQANVNPSKLSLGNLSDVAMEELENEGFIPKAHASPSPFKKTPSPGQ